MDYYGAPEDLRGRFLFLAARTDATGTTSVAQASIYEFDLTKRVLRKITDSPPGYLAASRSGELFCVVSKEQGTPAARRPFLYAQSVNRSCTVQLEKRPDQTVLIGHHAFFLIRDEKYLVDFNFDTQKKTFVGYHNASTWARGYVSQLSQNLQAPNGPDALHFNYWHWKGVTEGARRASGFYDLDVNSGSIRWSPQQEDPSLFYRAHNGQFVYFKGRNSPVHGFDLAMSPWVDDEWALREDPQGKRTRALHAFPRHRIPGGCYTLELISPDGMCALVSHYHGGRSREFYVVNVDSGKAGLLLKEKSILGGPFDEDPVCWLP